MKKLSLLTLLLALAANIYSLEIPVSNAKVENGTFVWEVIAVDFRTDCTVVTKRVTPKINGTWISSGYDEFIDNASTKQRYYILWSSIGFEQEKVILNDRQPVTFTEVYPSVGNATRVGINSGTKYYVSGLDTDPFTTFDPRVDRSYTTSVCTTKITDVMIDDDCTYVALDVYSYHAAGGWISFADNIVLTDQSGNLALKVMELYACDQDGMIVEQKNLGERYDVEKGARNRILLVFPRIPNGIHTIDIDEPDGFFWHGIHIKNAD